MSEVFITRKGGGAKTSAPELLITEVGVTWVEFEVTNTDQVQAAQIFLLANYDPNSEEDFDLLAIQSGKVITVAAGGTATEFLQSLDPATTHTISAQAAVIKKLPSSIVTTDPTDLLQTGLPAPTLGTPIDPISDTSLQIPVTNNETKIPLVIKVAATTSTATPSVYPFEITVQPNSSSNITITGLTVGTSYYYHGIAVDETIESDNVFVGPFVKKYVFTSFTFTNAAVTGRNGPTLAQATSAYSAASWAQSTNFFNITTQGIQAWTVPASGTYRIEVAGARGANGNNNTAIGGNGARLRADVALTEDTVLNIVVGQQGTVGAVGRGGGGGGGTFVYTGAIGGNGLIIAAGGGGGGDDNAPNGSTARSDLQPTESGTNIVRSNDGLGGTTGQGSGAGWLGNGTGTTYPGTRWVGADGIDNAGFGGFGGGGGDGDDGGAAGGFTGGSGTGGGGAGGSYYAGLTVPGGYTSTFAGSTSNFSWIATNGGHGFVTITLL